MADDIVDAAQKAINDAAVKAGTPPPPTLVVANEPASSIPSEPHPEPVLTTTPESIPETPTPLIVPPAAVPTTPKEEHKTMDPAKEAVVNELLGTATVAPPAEPKPEEKTHTGSPPIGPKKKSATGFIMAVLATIMLTIPVAVYYISQQNQQIADVRSRATGTTPYCGDGSCNGTERISTCGADCGSGTINCGGTQCAAQDCHCQGGDACTSLVCEPGIANNCIGQGRSMCSNSQNGGGMTCCNRGYVCNPSGEGCVPGGGGGCTGDDCGGGDDDPTPTPIAPICQNLKIYKGGVQVTPNTLLPGDEVVLAVKGNLTPTKARFRVNGGTFQETTTKNAANEFTLNYTIPDGITAFVIEAEVFTNGAYH